MLTKFVLSVNIYWVHQKPIRNTVWDHESHFIYPRENRFVSSHPCVILPCFPLLWGRLVSKWGNIFIQFMLQESAGKNLYYYLVLWAECKKPWVRFESELGKILMQYILRKFDASLPQDILHRFIEFSVSALE